MGLEVMRGVVLAVWSSKLQQLWKRQQQCVVLVVASVCCNSFCRGTSCSGPGS